MVPTLICISFSSTTTTETTKIEGERAVQTTFAAWYHRTPSHCEPPGCFLCSSTFSDFCPVPYSICNLGGIFNLSLCFLIYKMEVWCITDSHKFFHAIPITGWDLCLSLDCSSGGALWLPDRRTIAEVMLCAFIHTGLKRLAASASCLRIPTLRGAARHAVGGAWANHREKSESERDAG